MSVDVNFLQYLYTKVKLEDKLKGTFTSDC